MKLVYMIVAVVLSSAILQARMPVGPKPCTPETMGLVLGIGSIVLGTLSEDGKIKAVGEYSRPNCTPQSLPKCQTTEFNCAGRIDPALTLTGVKGRILTKVYLDTVVRPACGSNYYTLCANGYTDGSCKYNYDFFVANAENRSWNLFDVKAVEKEGFRLVRIPRGESYTMEFPAALKTQMTTRSKLVALQNGNNFLVVLYGSSDPYVLSFDIKGKLLGEFELQRDIIGCKF